MASSLNSDTTTCTLPYTCDHEGGAAHATSASISPETCNLMQANHSYAPCLSYTPCLAAEPKASPPRPLRTSEVEHRLLDAGVTPETLMAQWGVTLWSIKPKSERIKIKIDAQGTVDLPGLERWFAGILGQPVSIKQSPSSACCESPCKGCIWVDPEKRAFWGRPQCQPESPSP